MQAALWGNDRREVVDSLLEDLRAIEQVAEEILFICGPQLEKLIEKDLRMSLYEVENFYRIVACQRPASDGNVDGDATRERQEAFKKIAVHPIQMQEYFRRLAKHELHISSDTGSTPSEAV